MKDTFIHARISIELKEKLVKICEENHRSQSEQIAFWIAKENQEE